MREIKEFADEPSPDYSATPIEVRKQGLSEI
jgi:hypothetical protein